MDDIVSVDWLVDALEEGELEGVERLGGLERRKRFDDEVGVSDQDSCTVDLLRGGIVVRLSIDKVAGLHIQQLHLDGEWGVLFDALVTVLWEDELAARSKVKTDDATHLRWSS